MGVDSPIGIFDSGIGGLTVAHAIHKNLPGEKIIYFGDIAHLPYGDKSVDAIRYYSIKISKFLLDQGCKMIVVACNSASAAAADILKDFFEDQVVFVNVVDPLVQKAVKSNYNNVGVIATKATINSSVFKKKIQAQSSSITVSQLATPLLAPMIEEGFHNKAISQALLNEYLSDPILNNIDALLLACTHYPLIKDQIKEYYNNQIEIIDSTDVVVAQVKNILKDKDLLNPLEKNEQIFYVSDYTTSFEETTQVFYKQKVNLIEKSIW